MKVSYIGKSCHRQIIALTNKQLSTCFGSQVLTDPAAISAKNPTGTRPGRPTNVTQNSHIVSVANEKRKLNEEEVRNATKNAALVVKLQKQLQDAK
jgi:hypothetical protein